MTLVQAHQLLGELVRLKADVERYQRAMGALGMVPEVHTSAHDKISHLAYHSHRSYVRLECRLAKILASAPDRMPLMDCGDPAATNPRM